MQVKCIRLLVGGKTESKMKHPSLRLGRGESQPCTDQHNQSCQSHHDGTRVQQVWCGFPHLGCDRLNVTVSKVNHKFQRWLRGVASVLFSSERLH